MKKSLTFCGALAGLLAVGLAFGCQVGEASPEKVTRKFFAAIEKGDAMSLSEYASPNTVNHVMWLEQGGATAKAQAASRASGALLGGLFGSLLGAANVSGGASAAADSAIGAGIGSSVGGTIGGSVGAGGEEEAKYPMCRRGMIARGRIVSVKELARFQNTRESPPSLSSFVEVKFSGGTTEIVRLAKGGPNTFKGELWKISQEKSAQVMNWLATGSTLDEILEIAGKSDGITRLL